MKVYFATTVIGDRSNLAAMREIVSVLEKKGHTVLTKHLFLDNAYEIDTKITEQQVFDRDVKWLHEADVVLADATGSSFGVGFEVGFALGCLNKKVFLTFNKNYSISRMALGLRNDKCVKFGYSDVGELKEFVAKNF